MSKEEWYMLSEKGPDSNQIILLRVGTSIHYGVKKGNEYFKAKPIRSEACKCIVGHELEKVPLASIKDWRYPFNRNQMNGIYEELLL